MDNKFRLSQAQLGDLVLSDTNGYEVICMVVGVPNKSIGETYVRLKIMSEQVNRYFPKTGTTFQQSPHSRLWKPLNLEAK